MKAGLAGAIIVAGGLDDMPGRDAMRLDQVVKPGALEEWTVLNDRAAHPTAPA